MDIEVLDRANNLKDKIEKTKHILNSISYKKIRVNRTEKEFRRKATYTERFWLFKVLFRNKGDKATVVVFDNDSRHGLEVECDEEFLDWIALYYQNKLKILEQEFEELE